MDTIATANAAIEKYKADNRGEQPLYIVAYADVADALIEAEKKFNGHNVDTLVTTYCKIKVVKHDALKPGEFRLTNELPETGS